MLKLRPYQDKAVADVRTSYIEGFRAPLLVAPTGAGKTVIFSYVSATAAARGKRVLILVHRVELLRQTSKKLSEAGVGHGLVNPKYTPAYHEPVQVASVQTLINRLDRLHPPDLIVIDEAHHVAGKNTWARIIDAYKGSLLLGVTATPIRGDGNGLGVNSGGMFDTLVMGPTIRELIGQGFLVKPTVYAPKERIDLSGVRTVRGDYEVKSLAEVMDKATITGDAVAHYQRVCPGAPAVAFCVSVNHAKHVAEQFRAAGYRAYHADGSMDDETRSAILNGLGNGSVDVVTSCDLISEGTDIPAIGCAILLRPTQSLGLYLQQVGRALRPCEGKDKAIILDHVGNVLCHGMPDDDREWWLEGEKKSKRKAKSEPTIRVEQCPTCYSIHPPGPACPNCGYKYEVAPKGSEPNQVEGHLEEITDADREKLRRVQRKQVAQAKTLEELEAIALARGYKPGWARHVYNSRQKKLSFVQ